MIFALLTLLTSLALASVAGWFSIVGFMAIYAGAPVPALIMGAVTEVAKLVTISWLYRNWEYANWKIKAPLMYFTIALMTATSIGVFGFLSKGHLEQGSGTLDNSAKIETLNYQIQREKNLIADNEKMIGQLDATVNSFLGKDRTDRSLSVRRSQAPQREQLRKDSDAAQKRIDTLSEEKFKLESEVRKMELEVGPIRYIAELFYGVEDNATKNIEAAVRIFTLLLVSTLDPLAVVLLIAANHTLLRLKNEKEKKTETPDYDGSTDNKTAGSWEESRKEYAEVEETPVSNNAFRFQSDNEISRQRTEEDEVSDAVLQEPVEQINEEKKTFTDKTEDFPEILFPEQPSVGNDKGQERTNEEPVDIIREILSETPATTNKGKEEKISEVDVAELKSALEKFSNKSSLPIVRQPTPTRVAFHEEITPSPLKHEDTVPAPYQDAVIRELLGNEYHFIPKKVNEEEKPDEKKQSEKTRTTSDSSSEVEKVQHQESATEQDSKEVQVGLDKSNQVNIDNKYKYPKALSWLTEFKRT